MTVISRNTTMRNVLVTAFSPLSIANDILSLDSSESERFDLSGSLINVWNDVSVTANNGQQTTPSHRPTYLLNALNGMNVTSYGGFDDELDLLSTILLTAEFTIFIVCRTTSITQTRFYLGKSTGVNTAKLGTFNSKLFVRITSGGASDTSQAVPSGYFLLCLTRDSANKIDLSLNDGAIVRLFSDVAQSGTMDINRIGTDEAGQNWNGQIASIDIYDRKLIDSEISSYKRYSLNKWALI